MENRLIALKLVLDELETTKIRTLDDRKNVQKSIYLGQCSGVELGYRFGWYPIGPYSDDLEIDHFALSAELEAGESPIGYCLRDDIRTRLQRVHLILKVPPGVQLEQEDWLELLASLQP